MPCCENRFPEQIRVTGNTVIDALMWSVERERGRSDEWRRKHPYTGNGPMLLVTGIAARILVTACCNCATHLKNSPKCTLHCKSSTPCILTQRHGASSGQPFRQTNIHLIPPASYPEFVWLMDQASIVLTDSGGFRKKLRRWAPSASDSRQNRASRSDRSRLGRACRTDRQKIVRRVTELLMSAKSKQSIPSNPYGDGKACGRILDWMVEAGQRGWA